MSMLKVDNFLSFFCIFDILTLSHNKEGVDISMRKDITSEKLMLSKKNKKTNIFIVNFKMLVFI